MHPWRLFIMAIIALALSVLTTVGVSWYWGMQYAHLWGIVGSEGFVTIEVDKLAVVDGGERSRIVGIGQSRGVTICQVWIDHDDGTWEALPRSTVDPRSLHWVDLSASDEYESATIAFGWPMRAMRGWSTWPEPTSGGEPRYMGFISVAPAHWNPRHLPLDPIWPNFAWNTLLVWPFWIFVVVFAAPMLVRRILRARDRAFRGQCRRCGHDLRGTQPNTCPECGYPQPTAPVS